MDYGVGLVAEISDAGKKGSLLLAGHRLGRCEGVTAGSMRAGQATYKKPVSLALVKGSGDGSSVIGVR